MKHSKNILGVAITVLIVASAIWFYHYRENTMTKALGGTELPDLSKPIRPAESAEREIRERLTNDIVRLNRIVSLDIQHTDPEPTNWTAEAVVEYVNRAGGIDRTNLPYKCYQPHLWYVDTEKLYHNETAAH